MKTPIIIDPAAVSDTMVLSADMQPALAQQQPTATATAAKCAKLPADATSLQLQLAG
ncbi:MAG: hypothetical protein WC304_00205 [Candidatus Gracilibacteria bacterium]|jgi:hypothetical protein